MERFKSPLDAINHRCSEAKLILSTLISNDSLNTGERSEFVGMMYDKSSRTWGYMASFKSQDPATFALFEMHLDDLSRVFRELSRYNRGDLEFDSVGVYVERIIDSATEPIFGLYQAYEKILNTHK